MKSSSKASVVTVPVVRMPHAAGLALPSYQTEGAAGLDLVAAIPIERPLRLVPRARARVPTGLQLALPIGYEAQVRPRSGLADRHGVTVLNSPGTIDSDYRGEVQVILINLGTDNFTIRRGERIAQLVIAPVTRAVLEATETLDDTDRGEGGFGSTGRKTAAAPAKKSKPAADVSAKSKKSSAVAVQRLTDRR